MPTYSYKCQNCEELIEVFHAISANPPKTCKKCNGTLKKVPSVCGGIIIKGQSTCSSLPTCKAASNTCCKGGTGNSPCGL